MTKRSENRQINIGNGIYNEGQNRGIQAGGDINLGTEPNQKLFNDNAIETSSSNYSKMKLLFGLLMKHFNNDELISLCFSLNVDYDTLRGEGKEGKARELVLLMERLDRISELQNEISHFRPNIG